MPPSRRDERFANGLVMLFFGLVVGGLGLAIACSEPSGHAAGSGAGLAGIEAIGRMCVGGFIALVGAPLAVLGAARVIAHAIAPRPAPPPPWPAPPVPAVPAGLPAARVVRPRAPAPGRGARGSAR